MVLSDPVLDVIRRELRRLSPEVRIENEQIRAVLTSEVIKREVMEGDKATEAKKKIARAASKALRATNSKERIPEGVPVEQVVTESSQVGVEATPPLS
jgi:tRNA threonylcarbamoyladenosine modification (KEOPS) complex Cgi121 subunit